MACQRGASLRGIVLLNGVTKLAKRDESYPADRCDHPSSTRQTPYPECRSRFLQGVLFVGPRLADMRATLCVGDLVNYIVDAENVAVYDHDPTLEKLIAS